MLIHDPRQIRNISVPERVIKLPCGYTATFRWQDGMRIEWEPEVPRIHSERHRRKFFEAYKIARREFMTDVAATIGWGIFIADADGSDFELVAPPTKQ